MNAQADLSLCWCTGNFAGFVVRQISPAGPGSLVGCMSAWHVDGRGFDPQVRQHSFVEIGHNFYGHSLPTADSSNAVVSYWRKYVHLVLVNCLGSLPRNSVVRLTDRLNMIIVVDRDVKPQIKQTNLSHFRKYSNIQTTDQRQRYKQEFNTEYEEYKQLHYCVEKVCKKFNQFEVLLKKTPKHTQAFEVRITYRYSKNTKNLDAQKIYSKYLKI